MRDLEKVKIINLQPIGCDVILGLSNSLKTLGLVTRLMYLKKKKKKKRITSASKSECVPVIMEGIVDLEAPAETLPLDAAHNFQAPLLSGITYSPLLLSLSGH